MIVSSVLLADLKRQLAMLEADLRAQSEDPEVPWAIDLATEHARATERGRTARTWSEWRDGEIAQAAVAWILATTFVRFCEDNHLLDGAAPSAVWIAGPGERLGRAVENQTAHYAEHPTDNDRDWLRVAFEVLAALPAGRGLVDPSHNPVWRAPISADAAQALVAFWRRRDDSGALVHDFTDPGLDTRFLGDLYQDLSEYAKKTYALLQTPAFVEEFILDQPGSGRGVHPRPDPGPCDRRVRPPWPQDHRPDLRLGPLPPRRLRPAQRRVAAAQPKPRPEIPSPEGPRLDPRSRPQPLRRRDRQVPPHRRGSPGGRRTIPHRRPSLHLPPRHRRQPAG